MEKLPVSREEFHKYMDAIKRIHTIDKSIRDILWDNKCDSDFFLPDFSLDDELVELLDKVMHKPDALCDDIGYFVYELDMGEKHTLGCVSDKDDNPIDFGSVDAVYTYLEKLWNE